MIVSEARLAANRLNGCQGEGPLSAETRSASARNSYKHGLTGQGIVLPEGVAEEIRTRAEEFTADLNPKTAAGAVFIGQMAVLSVRADRAAAHEMAAIAHNVRHAADDFDDERLDRVTVLFEGLADDPRVVLRKLRRMPEGVEKLIEAWEDLKDDLAIEADSTWSDEQMGRAANLMGWKARHARNSRLGVLARAMRGDFAGLDPAEGAGLDADDRRGWARSALVARIDAEIAELEAHYQTLDFEPLALDRAEAGARALFDASKPACLARRYESEARRGFSKALKEFRQVEAEFEAQSPPTPTPSSEAGMGSSREMPPAPMNAPGWLDLTAPLPGPPLVMLDNGKPLTYVEPDKLPF